MTDFPDWGICLTQVARVLWSDVGRAPSPAAGPLAGLPVGGRPPRSRGTAPPSRCQSDYLGQADTPLPPIHEAFRKQDPHNESGDTRSRGLCLRRSRQFGNLTLLARRLPPCSVTPRARSVRIGRAHV